ncbi:MAG: nucleoside triphosphate pyrophosphohydrolase [Spirochaetaceae bacterium]|jgi:tetrapyrrole methylase family protein/MazG family protein|nr:nucleoside triphosphate pyrophosphohydrolase [Spirochaetaceae bacterium]
METTKTQDAFQALYDIIVRLRSPGGCPWDIKQTPVTMRGDLVEESFEASEAISDGAPSHVREELGDVIQNAMLIAYMYEQDKSFTIADVVRETCEKLIRRHPHVFVEESAGISQAGKAETPEQVLAQWDRIKQNVEGRSGESILDSVSGGLPPLAKAMKLQKKAAKQGFDWPDGPEATAAIWDKVREEISETEEALKKADKLDAEEEFGDILFSMVNAARRFGIDPVIALDRSSAKFTKRFKYVESEMKKQGIPMNAAHLKEMDEFWDKAKLTALL